MDSKLITAFMSIAKSLFTWSHLEKNRVKEQHADPRNIANFADINEEVAHSLKAPQLTRTQTHAGNPLLAPRAESRTFQDEGLLKKLLQHRNKVPLSGRVIRAKPGAES